MQLLANSTYKYNKHFASSGAKLTTFDLSFSLFNINCLIKSILFSKIAAFNSSYN